MLWIAPSEKDSATASLEKRLWDAADQFRANSGLKAQEYSGPILGLIFLRFAEVRFSAQHSKLEAAGASSRRGSRVGEPAAYHAEGILYLAPEARFDHLLTLPEAADIGAKVNAAMRLIEQYNPQLAGVLPKTYNLFTGTLLKELLKKVSEIPATLDFDAFGRIYEYFLGAFAMTEGQGGGEFYTPSSIVKLLAEIIEPFHGRILDPACGSGGMFVQSEKFIEEHGGKIGDISIYGQESNHTTWRLAKMNLAIRGIEGNLGKEHADTFHRDLHPDLKADYVLANPPFNDSDWGGERLKEDKRWKYGIPPAGNANFAWVQHFIFHLAPTGYAGFVLANGSMSSNQSGEGEIRKNIIEADLVDCMVALPGQLFYSTQIPVCLWFIARDKKNGSFRDRRGETLFIDARKLGTMIDRVHRELTNEDIKKIADTYHAWRGDKDCKASYQDIPGFCKSATLDDIRSNNYILTPGRYVGSAPQEEDDEPFEEKMQRLVAQLREQQAEAAKLDAAIAKNLEELGYGK